MTPQYHPRDLKWDNKQPVRATQVLQKRRTSQAITLVKKGQRQPRKVDAAKRMSS